MSNNRNRIAKPSSKGGWTIPILLIFGIFLFMGFLLSMNSILSKFLALAIVIGSVILFVKRSLQDGIFGPLGVYDADKRYTILSIAIVCTLAIFMPVHSSDEVISRSVNNMEAKNVEQVDDKVLPDPEQIDLPSYEVIGTIVNRPISGMHGAILIPSFSPKTPEAVIEEIAKAIAEKEGCNSVNIFATRSAHKAMNSEIYRLSHIDATEGFLGVWDAANGFSPTVSETRDVELSLGELTRFREFVKQTEDFHTRFHDAYLAKKKSENDPDLENRSLVWQSYQQTYLTGIRNLVDSVFKFQNRQVQNLANSILMPHNLMYRVTASESRHAEYQEAKAVYEANLIKVHKFIEAPEPQISKSVETDDRDIDHAVRWFNKSYNVILRHAGDKSWEEIEDKTGRVMWQYSETARTKDYMEMYDAKRKYEVRIFADRMELKKDGKWIWVANGHWDTTRKKSDQAKAGSDSE